jgi:F0F1-type ATP synthase membrane subunit b/b'
MMSRTIRQLGVALAVALLCGITPAAAQQGKWAKNHPRREQVNKRLNNQNKRIQQGEANGTLTKGQAQQLHKEDKTIRKEERADAAANGGHITKQQQRQLNRQENQTSKQIYQQKHPGQADTP